MFTVVLLSLSLAHAQTPRKVNAFPEEYVGKTITFHNIAFWPTLFELSGYYNVEIDVSGEPDDPSWSFGSNNKIFGAVTKSIAHQIISSNNGGYKQYLFGTVTGKVIRSSKVFNAEYIFLITRIVNHPIDEPQNVVHVYSSKAH